jgi:hypothetical protein
MKNPLRYNERNTTSTHVKEVSKSVGEQGITKRLVETFIGQVARWWETHSPRLETWKKVLTYFIEHFGEKKLAKTSDNPLFKIRYNLME